MYQGPTPPELEFFKFKALIFKVLNKNATPVEFQYLVDHLTPEKLRLRDAQGQNLLYWVIFAADVNAPQLFIEIWNKYQALLTLDDFRPLEANKGRQPSPLYLLASMAKVNNFFECVWNRFKTAFTINDLNDHVKSFDGKITTVFGFLAESALQNASLFSEIFARFKGSITQAMIYSQHYYLARTKKSPIHSIIEGTLTGKLDPQILHICLAQFMFTEADLNDLPEGYQMSADSMKKIAEHITPAGEIAVIKLNKMFDKKLAFLQALKEIKTRPRQDHAKLMTLAGEATQAGYYGAFPTLLIFYLNNKQMDLAWNAVKKVPAEHYFYREFQNKFCNHAENHLKIFISDEITTNLLSNGLEVALKIEDSATRYRTLQRLAYVFINKRTLAENQPGPIPDNLLALMNAKTPVEWCVMKVKALKAGLIHAASPHLAPPVVPNSPTAIQADVAKPIPPVARPAVMAKPVPPVAKPAVIAKSIGKPASGVTAKPSPRQEAEAIVGLFTLSAAKPRAAMANAGVENAKPPAKRAKK